MSERHDDSQHGLHPQPTDATSLANWALASQPAYDPQVTALAQQIAEQMRTQGPAVTPVCDGSAVDGWIPPQSPK